MIPFRIHCARWNFINKYRELTDAGDHTEAAKYKLYGVCLTQAEVCGIFPFNHWASEHRSRSHAAAGV